MKNVNKIFNMDSVYLRRLYTTSRLAFRTENKFIKKGGIVFVGDSITDFCNLDKYYPGLNATNRGISGDTIEGIKGRLEESIFGLSPSLIVILGGANNFAEGYDDVESFIIDNYREILSRIKVRLPEAKVLVQSVYPVSDVSFHNRYKYGHGHIEAINKELKKLTSSFGYEFADVYSQITSGNEEFDEKYTDDGLHPNKKGYEIISGFLRPIIDGMIGSPTKENGALLPLNEKKERDEKNSLKEKEETTSFIEKILVSVLGWVMGILFCVNVSAAVSITLGVILCVYGIVNLIVMGITRRPLFSVMGILNGIMIAVGIAFCTHDLSTLIVLLIPFVMEILGALMLVDGFVCRFLLKQGSTSRLIVFLSVGAATCSLGLCFLCIEDFRLEYSQLIVGIMLCVSSVVLFAFTLLKKKRRGKNTTNTEEKQDIESGNDEE